MVDEFENPDDGSDLELSEESLKRNERRWRKFREDPDYETVAVLVRAVIDAAGLQRADFNKTWSISVHVDKETFLRVNHADYSLFDIRHPHKTLGSRTISLAVLPEGRGLKVGLIQNVLRKVLAKGYITQRGFTKYVPESVVIFSRYGKLESLLSMPEVREGLRRHVAARPRNLFKSRKNQLTLEILG